MNLQVARSLMGRCSVVVVSDAFRLAPWADGLVSQDAKWWASNPDAMQFAGRKFSGALMEGVEKVQFEGPIASGSNSGLLAMHVAVTKFGATRLLLLGFDMCGGHFFGPHVAPLRNTSPSRFDAFKEQFKRYRPRGVEIINCTPGSVLKAYRMADLNDCLNGGL